MHLEVSKILSADLHLEGEELRMLQALAQNPHPSYQDNPVIMEFARKLFYTLQEAQ